MEITKEQVIQYLDDFTNKCDHNCFNCCVGILTEGGQDCAIGVVNYGLENEEFYNLLKGSD